MVLFVMQHIGGLYQILTFRFLKHRNQKAILLMCEGHKNVTFINNMEGEIFDKIVLFKVKDRKEYLEENTWEEQVVKDYGSIFAGMGIRISDFSDIYCAHDLCNDFYYYCEHEKVYVNYLEIAPGLLSSKDPYSLLTELGSDPLHEVFSRKYDTVRGGISSYVKTRYVFRKTLDKDVETDFYNDLYKIDSKSIALIGKAISINKFDITTDRCSVFLFNSEGWTALRSKVDTYFSHAIICDIYLNKIGNLIIKDHPNNRGKRNLKEVKSLFESVPNLPADIPLELIVLTKRCKFDKVISCASTGNAKIANYVNENVVLGNEPYLYWRCLLKLMISYEVEKILGETYREYFHGISKPLLVNYRKSIVYPFFEGFPKDINTSILKGKIFTIIDKIEAENEKNIENALENADKETVVVFWNTDESFLFVPYNEKLLENFVVVKICKTALENNLYPDLTDEFVYFFSKDLEIREKLKQYSYDRDLKYTKCNIHAEFAHGSGILKLQNERKRRLKAENEKEQLVREKSQLEGALKNASSQLEAVRKDTMSVMSEEKSFIHSKSDWEQRFYHRLHLLQWASFYPAGTIEGYIYLCAVLESLVSNPVKNVLEFGCSTSSYLVGKHVSEVEGHHLVLEYDKNWAEFVVSQNRHTFSSTTINGGGLGVREFDGDRFYSYAAAQRLQPEAKFGLILIKHPLGRSDMPIGDILNILPQCLEEEFIILSPHSAKESYARLSHKIEHSLLVSGIGFEKYLYGGEVCIFCSHGNKYRFQSDGDLMKRSFNPPSEGVG